MDTLFVQLKKLYDNELYDQVQPVVSKLDKLHCSESRKNTGISQAKHMSN